MNTSSGFRTPTRLHRQVVFALLLTLSVPAVGWAERISVEVRMTGLQPDPAVLNLDQQAAAGLTAEAGDTSVSEEAKLIGPWWTWNYEVYSCDTSPVPIDPEHRNGSGATVSITPPTSTQRMPTATLTARFTRSSFWVIRVHARVEYCDGEGGYWEGDGYANIPMTSGDWPYIADVKNPAQSDAGAEVCRNQNEEVYLRREWHKSHNWCKAYVWGKRIPDDASTWDVSNWQVFAQSGANPATWKRTREWDRGPVAPRTSFEYVVQANMEWNVEGDVDNNTFLPPHGAGSTKSQSQLDITRGPGGGAAQTEKLEFNLDRVEGDRIEWTFSYPWGISGGIEEKDEWADSGTTLTQTCRGTIDSDGELQVWSKTSIWGWARITWANNAEGPFQALGDVEVESIAMNREQ